VAQRENLAKEILEKSLSVRQTEKTAQDLKAASPKQGQIPSAQRSNQTIDSELAKFTQDLTRRYMAKVDFKGTLKSGQIQIKYSSKEDLHRILSILMGD
jgi:ParB-like chromosome segregation protein Spo0J